MQIRFTPTFDEMVDLTIFVTRHPAPYWKSRSSAVRGWAQFAVGLAVAFLLPSVLARILPWHLSDLLTLTGPGLPSIWASLVFLIVYLPSMWELLVVFLIVYLLVRMAWQRARMRSRYRTLLAPHRPVLDHAGALTLELTESGVRVSDALHLAQYPWKGIAIVRDDPRWAVVLFPYMGGQVGAPARAFATPADAEAFRAFAQKCVAEAARAQDGDSEIRPDSSGQIATDSVG